MLKIYKTILHSAVDYAAEELKKYLRMMMPDGGDIKISYDPEAKDGFRLGLMQDAGLDVSDAEDVELDDILYIDCDREGGIIAGSNPRSVLLAVYEYLRQNGCRWLLPGPDGEYIPMKDIIPVKYRHKPSMRYRGWCNEGAEFQRSMLDAIELAPKLGLNVFMLEFRIPVGYYSVYYKHTLNEENRNPEPVTETQILQWKRQCESEISKRGLQFHDIGHGWTADAFGIDSSLREGTENNDALIPDEARKFVAMINGERKMYRNRPNFTNFCMSNPEAQRLFVKCVADYAESHSNADYLHVWLADLDNNHCECEECQKKTPSDWYVILLNMIDEELTARGLDTRIVFCAYVDTAWAPETEVIRNQDRFSLLFAPISRSYLETLPELGVKAVTEPYKRNKNELPKSLEEYFAHLLNWKKTWHGACFSYEYHLWRYMIYDISGYDISNRINNDVKAYKEYGVNGIIEDGTQRPFFPTALPLYTYARTLYDATLTTEEIRKEYMQAAFGEAKDEFENYLGEIAELIKPHYFMGKYSADRSVSSLYSPEQSKKFLKLKEVTARGRELIKSHYNSDYRLGTLSVRLLEKHADYCDYLADAFALKAVAKDEEAEMLYEKMRVEMGKLEPEIQSYFDHWMYMHYWRFFFKSRSNITKPLIASV